MLSHPLVSPGDKLFSDSYRNSLHYSYSHSQHEGKWLDAFQWIGQKYESFRCPQFCMLLAKSLLFPLQIWVLMCKVPQSLLLLCKRGLSVLWRGDSQWVSFLNLWSLGVVHNHLQLGWQGAQCTLPLVYPVI